MPDSYLRRLGVDGRVELGHDEGGVPARNRQWPDQHPTLYAPLCLLQKSEAVPDNLGSQKRERAWRGALGIRTRGEEDGEGAARANASCESGQALEKAQNGNGRLLEKVGMDLGLAPRPLGVGATSAWGRRNVGLGLAPRRFGVDGAMPIVNAISFIPLG